VMESVTNTATAPTHTNSKPSPAIVNVETSQPPPAPRPESAAGVKRAAPDDEETSVATSHAQPVERDAKRAKTEAQSEAGPAS